jgi:hypothetical protein
MIPAAVVCASRNGGGMPMTANGKVDRAALPAPASLRRLGSEEDGGDTTERSPAYVAPDGDAEEAVAALFEEVLSPEGGVQVGALDDFFELGGGALAQVAPQLASSWFQPLHLKCDFLVVF